MNIIEKYIETNKSLLDDLVANDPTLASGVIDALAVLNNYINANNIEFTEQEEGKILVPADLEERAKLELQEKERLAKAESDARVIQETLGKIDAQTKDIQDCVFYWRRETMGGTDGAYFLLASTNDLKSIIFATNLAKGVFVDNPTTFNQKIRNLYNVGFLIDGNLGVITYQYPSLTMKDEADANSRKGIQEEIIYYLNKIGSNANPTMLVIDDNRVGANFLLTDIRNPNGVVSGRNLIESQGYKLTHALNTLMMVAWAEGVDLSLDVYDDFFALALCYEDAIRSSVQFKERAYIVLTRETDTEESELLNRLGTDATENLIKEKGAENAFVVSIVVDGVFQDGINPYMFSAKAQTATPPPPISPQQIAEASALKTSSFTTENVYVIKKKDGSFEVVVGENNLDNSKKSPDFLSVVEVFNDGVSTASAPTKVTLTRGKSITQAELDAITNAKLEAYAESHTTSENVYAIQKQDDSFVIKVGETEAYKIIHSTDFQSVVGVYKLGKEINLPLLPPPTTTTKQYAIPSTEPSTWDAVFDIGSKVKIRLDFSKDKGDGASEVDYDSPQNSFLVVEKKYLIAMKRPENPSGVLYKLNNGQNWEGKDLEALSTPLILPPTQTTTENELTDWEVAGMSKEEWDTRNKGIEASKITTEKCYVVKLKNGAYVMEVGDENVLNLVDTDQFEELIAVYKDGFIVSTEMPLPKIPNLSGVGKSSIFNKKRAKEASEETDEYVYLVKFKNGDYGIAEGDDKLFEIEDSGDLADVSATYKNGTQVSTIRPKRVYATESPESHTHEIVEEITEEELKDLPPIELHIKNKDAFKTDFSLLEDINFEDEE